MAGRHVSLAVAVLSALATCLKTAPVRADHTAAVQKAADDSAKQAEESETPGGPQANEAVRAKEGATTALPSVAGRPVRRYAEQGILELGGSLNVVKSAAFTQAGAAPSFGWFVIDYLQLSLIPSFDYVKTAVAPATGRYSVIFEPSFHVQIAGPVFGFFGAGAGAAYETASGVGLAIVPRSGVNVLIGGSGVLTAAFSFVYTATKRSAIEDGSTDSHTSTLGLQMGYSVAW